MGIFNRGPVTRLDEEELREIYLDSKRIEKIMSVIYMIFSGVLSIGIICYAVIKETYWILSFSVVSVVAFIALISRFSRLIEDIFENRIFEEEEEDAH